MPSKVLTDAQVRKVRKSYKTGKFTQTELARRFDVSQNGISKIVNGLRRADVR